MNPEFRLLIQRSNLYVKAQVLGADGVVIATTTDKAASGATKTERAAAAGEAFAAVLKEKKVEKLQKKMEKLQGEIDKLRQRVEFVGRW